MHHAGILGGRELGNSPSLIDVELRVSPIAVRADIATSRERCTGLLEGELW